MLNKKHGVLYLLSCKRTKHFRVPIAMFLLLGHFLYWKIQLHESRSNSSKTWSESCATPWLKLIIATTTQHEPRKHYYRNMSCSTWHSTQHWMGKAQFHPCGFLVEVTSDLEPMARCPLWFHHAPLPSTQVHQFPLKIHYESTKSSIWNPPIIQYAHI